MEDFAYNIVYAVNDDFCEIMGVSIASLLENNSEILKNLRITVLSSDITDENKKKIEQIFIRFGAVIPRWIDATDTETRLKYRVTLDRGSVSQYSRLFIDGIFDNSVSRVLYLDADTVIENSIKELWNLDLEGNTIGALKDAFSKYYRKNVGLEENDIMFNSGVLLIDVKKWRERNVEKRLLDFIADHRGYIQQGDQGVLNGVLSKETYPLTPRYNLISAFSVFSYKQMILYRKPVACYSENEVNAAVKDPVIIHYTSNFFSDRPWYEGCNTKYAKKWVEYRNLTPWKNNKLRSPNKSLLSRIYNVLPDTVGLRCASIFQAYLRPLKNRFIILIRGF